MEKLPVEETFQKTESGASFTYPVQVGNLKKGDYVMLKGHACKVMEMTTSKAGKHGHAKATIVGLDIFTDKKYEDGFPTSHNVDAPFVTRKEFPLVDIDKSGKKGSGQMFVSLLKEDGSIREDLKLPEGEIRDRILKDFDNEKSLLLTVVGALGEEKIVGSREDQQS